MPRLQLQSPAFAFEGSLPARHTCDGEGSSPPLDWTPGPPGTRSYALLVEDLDPPSGPWVNWLAWNIGQTSLAEGAAEADGFVRGRNSRGERGYDPPCPPTGEHRYFFRIYALGAELDLAAGATSDELLAAIDGLVLASGELVARYERAPR